MKKWKELFVKNYKVVQICGCVCLIGALGAGIYSLQGGNVSAKEAEVVAKTDTREEHTAVKKEKDKTDSPKKTEIQTVKAEMKNTEKEAPKKTAKKEAASVQQKPEEKKEEKKADPKQKKEQKPQENPVSAPEQSVQPEQQPQESTAPAPEQSVQPEQQLQENPSPAPEQPAQPEQKPQENPAPAPEQPQQPQKPEHVHNWVYHDEQGHENTYTVTEEVYEPWECCNVCGADCTADPSGHMKAHALAGEGGGRHTEYYKTKEVTKTEWIVDVPAYTECSGCGARQ